jgi:iron complex outermembrane receptor protein
MPGFNQGGGIMHKHFHTALLTVLVLLAPIPGHGTDQDTQEARAFEEVFGSGPQEEDIYRTDRLLLTATGSLKPVHLAPTVATVITAEDIEAMGATTLNEVLETVPGLHVSPSGPTIFTSIWSIRGMHTSTNPEVLMLLNGLPLTDTADGGRLKTTNMPVAMISRVEVVRGPGSAVHGADAFAGAINVITKDGHEVDGTRAGMRYGSFDTVAGWLQHGGTYGGWNVVAGAEARRTKGDRDRTVVLDRLGSGPPSWAPNALDTRAAQVDINLGANKEDRWITHFYGSWFGENGVGPGGLQALNNEESAVDGNQILADLQYNNNELSKDWNLSARVYYLYQKINIYNQLLPSSFLNMIGEPIVTANNGGFEASGIYEGYAKHALRTAVGLKYYNTETDEIKNFGPGVPIQYGPPVSVRGTPYIFMDDQHRFLWYASLQDEWNLTKGWELTAGIRYDEYDDFGGTINPRLALVWEARYDLTAKLLYGRAFRAPSFSEQYYQSNPVFQGNPDLDPETVDTYEVAFDWQPLANLRIIPSVFHYEIDDAIEFVGPLPARAENYASIEGNGFEVEANWQVLSSLELSANLAYQRSKDTNTEELVADTPAWQFYAAANWDFLPNWSLNGQYFWIADRHRANGDPRPQIDDYDLVNLTLRRKNIAKNWDAALSLRNLFDEDAREPSPFDPSAPGGAFIPGDYPLEGRAVWGEIRFHF